MKMLTVSNMNASAVALGCMRMHALDPAGVDAIMDAALASGINFFDHADIYGRGASERVFGEYLARHHGVREGVFIQTKCAIHDEQYDFSKEHIISSVEGSLARLGVDYVDALLLHRPDTLMEPEVVAEAFDLLADSGKVRYFGVSNHTPMQIELLKTAVKQPLLINQLQFSITEAGMVSAGMNANMKNEASVMRDGGVLEYSRIHGITIQAWSPFQRQKYLGSYIDCAELPELNARLAEIGEKYDLTKTGVAAAWILRHPANMQILAGTMNPARLAEICAGAAVTLSRAEWYEIYRAAGHTLP